MVLTGVALQSDGRVRGEDILDLRAQELGRCAERVAILPELASILLEGPLVLFRRSETGAREHAQDISSNLDLAGVRAGDGVDERGKGAEGAEHGLGAHRGADLGEEREVHGVVEGEGGDGGGEGGAVEDTEVFLGAEGDGLNTVLSEGLVRSNDFASAELGRAVEDTDGGVPNERTGDVGEGGKICDRDTQLADSSSKHRNNKKMKRVQGRF